MSGRIDSFFINFGQLIYFLVTTTTRCHLFKELLMIIMHVIKVAGHRKLIIICNVFPPLYFAMRISVLEQYRCIVVTVNRCIIVTLFSSY